jgi:hypothetical protein
VISQLRQLYYVVMSALEDPETQINGVVMMSSMPYQVKGWHTILAENVAPWLSWLTSILDQKSRMRMRMHNGTHQEILYSVRCAERNEQTDGLRLVGQSV